MLSKGNLITMCSSAVIHNNYVALSIKNQMKGDIGMANYEKQVEQEAAYHIPISLYNGYMTVRHEKRYQEYNSYASLLMPHCPVTVVQRYSMQPLVLHNLPSL